MHKIIDIKLLKDFEPIHGLKAKIIHTETESYAFWKIKEGTILGEHEHIHRQHSIILKGKLNLSIDGETSLMEEGMMAIIPSGAVHSAEAITDVELIDVFFPKRYDFPE